MNKPSLIFLVTLTSLAGLVVLKPYLSAFAQTANEWTIEKDTTDANKLKFYFNTNPPVISVTSDGNVGIGDNAPSRKFRVEGDAELGNNTLFTRSIRKVSGDLTLETDINDIYLNPAGGVGIGTADPGTDKLDVRGRAYSSGGWQSSDADYAEWFEKEQTTSPGDLIGVNLQTGRVRRYQTGDKFIGIHSTSPAVVGNRTEEQDLQMEQTHTLVGLLGQLPFDRSQVQINHRIVTTPDGQTIGVLLSNNKVLLGR